MNNKGQFSIIASLLVAVILISTVILTYSTIRNTQVQNQPRILSAIDETNLAIRQVLGFTIGYYGSILQVTGNTSYARTLATNYLQSGLVNIANMNPQWGASFKVTSSQLYTYWFSNSSYSAGTLAVAYNLTGLGILGVTYQTSCRLDVNATNGGSDQARLDVTQDESKPLINLGKQNFQFYNYLSANSTWLKISPITEPVSFGNGTYAVDTPAGVDPYSYLVQVEDQRGIIVLASSFTSYVANLTWPSISSKTSSYYYVSNSTSDVDSSPDVGTHSNFTDQQKSDGKFDTLTEANINGPQAYYPTGFSLLGSTQNVLGGLANLQSDDGVYMTFRSYQSASSAQPLYAHQETTSISGSNYYQLRTSSADASGTSLSASMTSVARTLLGSFVYPLAGIASIPSSTWTFYYRAWKSANPTIAYDTSSSRTQSTSQDFISWTHTTGNGNNRVILATISTYSSSGSPVTCSGCTYNGITMTQAVTAVYTTNPQVRSYIFYLTNPASGSHTLRANFSGSTVSIGGAVSYSGVDQTTPIQTWGSSQGSGQGQSVLVTTTQTGEAVYGSLASYRTSSPTSYSITDGSGENQRWLQTGQAYKGDSDDKLGVSPSSVSISWTTSRTVSYVCLAVAINPATPPAGHCDVDILIRKSDNTIRTTVATNVAASGAITTSASTLSGTYAWSNYNVVSGTDYLELDYYLDTTTACQGATASLRIDDNSLATSSQTSVTNIILPSQFTSEVEFSGVATTASPTQITWTIDSCCNISSVTTIFQLFNYSASVYPTTGDGFMTYVMGTSNVTETQTITANPACFRDVSGNWKLKVKAVASTQFDWKADFIRYVVSIPPSYQLDLEEQWQNVNYTDPGQKYVCVKTGALGAEALNVDVWNGSAWINVISNLTANAWNNASVSSLATTPTFVIRFKDTNETADSVQDNWQIDATLLRFDDTNQLLSNIHDTITIELRQNGTMQWLGQSLQMTTQAKPFLPIPTKAIHVNQTTSGVDSEVPFQIEDWASGYMIPLGLTNNASVFSDRTMLVFLVNPQVSKVTIWWNGSDTATQTPYAYTNRYFADNVAANTLSNGRLTLQLTDPGQFTFKATVGGSSCTVNFMRINQQQSIYGSDEPAYVITNGIVRDIIRQEPEWSGGAPGCPDFYAHIVLTLPANTTYFTYQLRLMFQDTKQSRKITDLSAIKLTGLTGQSQVENGTATGCPTVSNATGLFYNSSSVWQHHWSQFVQGTKGAGIMFPDDSNQKLYTFDSTAGNNTGAIRVNNTSATIELLPVAMSQVSFNNTLDVTWYGAVATFDGTTPIYNNSDQTGLWTLTEYPPLIAVSTEN